jgi:hypothetical protein
MGATFAATEAAVANTRETEDALNGAAGACAAGFLAGIRGTCPLYLPSCRLHQTHARALPQHAHSPWPSAHVQCSRPLSVRSTTQATA